LLHPLKKIFFAKPVQGLPDLMSIVPEHDHDFIPLWDDVAQVVVLKPKARNLKGAWRIPLGQVARMQLAPKPAGKVSADD